MLKRLIKEPLFHFFIIGTVIFIIAGYTINKKNSYNIVIDKNVAAKLSLAWKTQFGKLPDNDELKIAADQYIRQEILIREAIELGLDKDDEIIRRRLEQKMEFIQKDNINVPDPDDSQLEKYYEENGNKFKEPSKVSFTHIYFNPDNGGNTEAMNRAIEVKKSLDSKPETIRAPELGDRFSLLFDYNDIDKPESISLFGNSPFSDSVFTSPVNKWSGPFPSGYGWHLVYVNGKSDPVIPPLEMIKTKVLGFYRNDKLTELNDEEFNKIAEKYSVEIDTE